MQDETPFPGYSYIRVLQTFPMPTEAADAQHVESYIETGIWLRDY